MVKIQLFRNSKGLCFIRFSHLLKKSRSLNLIKCNLIANILQHHRISQKHNHQIAQLRCPLKFSPKYVLIIFTFQTLLSKTQKISHQLNHQARLNSCHFSDKNMIEIIIKLDKSEIQVLLLVQKINQDFFQREENQKLLTLKVFLMKSKILGNRSRKDSYIMKRKPINSQNNNQICRLKGSLVQFNQD